MTPNRRYDKIDGLRAYAAIGIVLMHVLANGGYDLGGFIFDALIPSFTNLVFLFMVVSGFSLCCGYYEKIVNAKITPAQFYSKRFKKVWPFFALLCLLDLAISPSVDALYEVLANLTLCFGLIPNANISVIGVGWFLGLVFVFYFLFPFFCYLLSNKTRAWVSFAATLVLNYLSVVYFNVGRSSIAYSAVFFMAGGMIYLYREPLQALAKRFGVLILLAVLVMAILYYTVGSFELIMLLLFSLMLIYALRPERRKYSLLSNPLVKKLSGISLEVYLSHMVIFRAIEKLKLTHLVNSDALSFAITAIGTFIGSIVFAFVMQKVIMLVGGHLNNKQHQE